MRRLQQLLFKLRVPMLILLPLWVAIGRLMFGAGGWLLLVTIFIVGPLLFVGLLTIFLLAKRRRDIVGGVLPKKDAIYMLIIYVSFFLYGFFDRRWRRHRRKRSIGCNETVSYVFFGCTEHLRAGVRSCGDRKSGRIYHV